jgi:hypothetical protein
VVLGRENVCFQVWKLFQTLPYIHLKALVQSTCTRIRNLKKYSFTKCDIEFSGKKRVRTEKWGRLVWWSIAPGERIGNWGGNPRDPSGVRRKE